MEDNTKQERIHILGVGNIGRLFAHALSKEKNPPPITLLFHRASMLEEWEKAGRNIQITTNGVPDQSRGYETELISTPDVWLDEGIKNLIVSTKTLYTASALSSIQHRLSPHSSVLFAQNGMGTIEKVTEEVFPEINLRPSYLACVTHHGVYSEGSFRSVHAGRANMTIGEVISPPSSAHKSNYLLSQILHSPLLSATQVSPAELLRLQLEKLVINAMINPLTVIFSRLNGELFTPGPIVSLMRSLLLEASQVIQRLPELRSDPSAPSRFSVQNLELKALEAADRTAMNVSSMLQDFRAGRETEIDFINGYLVRRGRELGVDCVNNETLVRMVKEGTVIGVEEIGSHFKELSYDINWADFLLIL